MTAALWMREFLKELHGITPEEITWYSGRTRELSQGGILGLDRTPPAGVDLHWLTEERALDEMLDKGEIDAAYGVAPGHHTEPAGLRPIDRYGGTPIQGNPRIRRLLPDSGQQVVADYHRRTGVLPSNHMVVVKSSVVDKFPRVALELLQAFQKSKELAYQWSKEMSRAYLLFEGEDFKRQADLFGADPYPLGLNANRGMLERLARASFEQGLTRKLACVDDLFHPSTRDT
jgi:4,5-dihydroxyphthalate decarboxylase